MAFEEASPAGTMTGFDKTKWAGRLSAQEDVYAPTSTWQRRDRDGEPGAIAKLLEENPIAFAIGAAVLAYVAVRALK